MTGRWLGRLVRMLTPWPAKAERRAAIDAARAERERSQRGAAHARDIKQQIEWLQEQNNWAGSIADALGLRNGERGK